MTLSETIFGAILVIGLVAVALFYGWRQVQQLRRLPAQSLPDEEMTWERRKAWRRLISSGLTLVMAGLLAVLLVFYESQAEHLATKRAQLPQEAKGRPTVEEKAFLRVWGGQVIALLVVLFAVVMLAGVDLWETRRFASKQFRKLQADRRAMIERQANRMRQDRNGHL